MRKVLIFVMILGLTGCQRGCEKFNRSVQFSPRQYHVEQYSGGKLVKTYKFYGILNNSENSDGYYFHKNDTLYEISGDIIVRSVD